MPVSWSPDGDALAVGGASFAFDGDQGMANGNTLTIYELELYVTDRDGESQLNPHRIRMKDDPERYATVASGPRWSPDGRHLVYLGYDLGWYALLTVAADGNSDPNCTDTLGHEPSPPHDR